MGGRSFDGESRKWGEEERIENKTYEKKLKKREIYYCKFGNEERNLEIRETEERNRENERTEKSQERCTEFAKWGLRERCREGM